MSNYILRIESHPFNGYSFDYDVIPDNEKTVDTLKNIIKEFYSELLPMVKYKFKELSDQIKSQRLIEGILDGIVSCETVDDINNIVGVSVEKRVDTKVKRKVKDKKENVVDTPITKKKKVKRIKFI